MSNKLTLLTFNKDEDMYVLTPCAYYLIIADACPCINIGEKIYYREEIMKLIIKYHIIYDFKIPSKLDALNWLSNYTNK